VTQENQVQSSSKFFFPLRTNVGYFDTSEGHLSLIERIKQAGLLYDELIFEPGVYMAFIWENGHIDMTFQPESDEMLAFMRSGFKPSGGEAQLLLQPEGGQMTPIFDGPTVRQFHCEFHSALRELNAESLSWVKLIPFELTDHGKSAAKLISEEFLTHLNEIVPDIEKYLRSKIVSNFGRDIALTSAMRVAASMNAMYAPILHRKAQMKEAQGFTSLQIVIPDLSQVGWDEILDLRNEKSLIEFRSVLSSLEKEIQGLLNEGDIDGAQRQRAIAQGFIDELSRELERVQPRKGEAIVEVILDLILGIIPGLSAFINLARAGDKLEQANRSWVAAFHRLRPPKI
jgi:hypothetical protein